MAESAAIQKRKPNGQCYKCLGKTTTFSGRVMEDAIYCEACSEEVSKNVLPMQSLNSQIDSGRYSSNTHKILDHCARIQGSTAVLMVKTLELPVTTVASILRRITQAQLLTVYCGKTKQQKFYNITQLGRDRLAEWNALQSKESE